MMLAKCFGRVAMVLVWAATAACSSSDTAAPKKTGPVAATPLRGTVNGSPFSAVYGKSTKDSSLDATGPVKRFVALYETKSSCAHEPEFGRVVVTMTPWLAGFAQDFSSSSLTASFFNHEMGKPDTSALSVDGRIEIIDAPTTPGSTGKVRLRASATGKDTGAVYSIEGEVDVEFCE